MRAVIIVLSPKADLPISISQKHSSRRRDERLYGQISNVQYNPKAFAVDCEMKHSICSTKLLLPLNYHKTLYIATNIIVWIQVGRIALSSVYIISMTILNLSMVNTKFHIRFCASYLPKTTDDTNEIFRSNTHFYYLGVMCIDKRPSAFQKNTATSPRTHQIIFDGQNRPARHHRIQPNKSTSQAHTPKRTRYAFVCVARIGKRFAAAAQRITTAYTKVHACAHKFDVQILSQHAMLSCGLCHAILAMGRCHI